MFSFPNLILKSAPATDLLKSQGVGSFHEAVNWVWKLSYGRTSVRANYMLVPIEKIGACSSKQAFLAQVAEEQGIPLKLHIGIFMMNSENTPGISSVLAESGLHSIPEAHCFLKFHEERYDFTFHDDSTRPFVKMNFLYEEAIVPSQIGNYKIQLHQKWLSHWGEKHHPNIPFSELWTVRENCILALSDH